VEGLDSILVCCSALLGVAVGDLSAALKYLCDMGLVVVLTLPLPLPIPASLAVSTLAWAPALVLQDLHLHLQKLMMTSLYSSGLV
jgi:hypothetical protein